MPMAWKCFGLLVMRYIVPPDQEVVVFVEPVVAVFFDLPIFSDFRNSEVCAIRKIQPGLKGLNTPSIAVLDFFNAKNEVSKASE